MLPPSWTPGRHWIEVKLGILAITLLYDWIGYPASLVLSFALVVAISAASYRWIEQPSQRLARQWTAAIPKPMLAATQ